MSETETAVDDGVQAEATGISQWEFLDRVPTRDEVLDLLNTLPPVWGVKTADYADYVQALPQSKKVKRPQERHSAETGETKTFIVDVFIDAFTLYMSVAGRIKMLEAAAEQNGWEVEFEPEPVTPTGVPGFLQLEGRMVYREYVKIVMHQTDSERVIPMGRKSGTAWVPSSGGKAAAGSNPYEKVETSARGRAIAAWGFGVLPGSGVASVEEMMGAGQNRAALEAEAATAQPRSGATTRKSRGDLLQEALALSESLRQERGIDEFEMRAKTAKYLTETLGVQGCWDEAKGEIDWSKVKDGQLQLLVNSQSDTLRRIRDEASPV